jgi:hypothetical protein
MFGRQVKLQRRRINLDHSGRHHGPEPLTDVALLEPRLGRDLHRSGRRQSAHGIEQPGSVADRHHQAEGAVVQRGQQFSAKGFGPRLIELGVRVLARHLFYLCGRRVTRAACVEVGPETACYPASS